jgi:hypothetical protein
MKVFFKSASVTIVAVASFSCQANATLQQGASAAAQAAIPIAITAAISSNGMAAALAHPCSTGNMATCAMMGLSIAQVGMALLQKSGSEQSANSLSSGYGNSAGTNGVTNADPNATYTTPDGTTVVGQTAKTANALVANGLGGLASDYVNSAKAVQASGVTVSPDGSSVTLPNGKKVASSAFSSPSSLKDAGFSASDIAGVENSLKNDVPKAIAAANAKAGSLTNDVGGGGGAAGAPGGGGGSDTYGGGGFGRFGKGFGAKKDANVSGLSKKFGSDNIGVSGDNIFDMITRRYQERDKVDTFLKN